MTKKVETVKVKSVKTKQVEINANTATVLNQAAYDAALAFQSVDKRLALVTEELLKLKVEREEKYIALCNTTDNKEAPIAILEDGQMLSLSYRSKAGYSKESGGSTCLRKLTLVTKKL